MKEKIIEQQIQGVTSQLLKVIESIHAHLEIIAREQIKARLLISDGQVSDDQVEDVLNEYQTKIN